MGWERAERHTTKSRVRAARSAEVPVGAALAVTAAERVRLNAMTAQHEPAAVCRERFGW